MANMRIEAELSDSSFVSLLTCGPGDEIYSMFGHTALRICDTTIGLDVVYNYGTYSSHVKHFVWKFMRGYMYYFLSRGSYDNFLISYAMEGRAVWEQPLELTLQERQNLLMMIELNYQPEYRYYWYDFFRDNCATRVRDIICDALDHRTLFTETIPPATNRSYRDIIHGLLESNDRLWTEFGIDLLLGARCDRPRNDWDYMFSPIDLMHEMDTVCVSNTGRPLAMSRRVVLDDTREARHPLPNPTVCMWILFVVVALLTLLGWRKQWSLRWLDIILFILVSLLSLVLLFLWFGSIHYCPKPNWNVLWANPLFIYYLFTLRKANRWVVLVGMVCLLVLMVGFWWLPQRFNPAVYPVALLLFVRLLDKLRIKQ